MSTKTKNYEFVKPELTDTADITATNTNWDKVDETLKGLDGALATEKTTLADADTLSVNDSTSSNVLKKITWANIKTLLGNLFALKTHTHEVADVNGTLLISNGGTGATTASAARTNLGITPANIGAASNANPKFTGSVALNEIVGLALNADGIAELTIKHKTEEGNSRKLYIAPSDEVGDLKSAIMLGDEYRGLTQLYKLYGDHNTTVETWTFTLEDGSTVTKAVYVG